MSDFNKTDDLARLTALHQESARICAEIKAAIEESDAIMAEADRVIKSNLEHIERTTFALLPADNKQNADWLTSQSISTLSDWELAERIERYETKIGSVSVTAEAVTAEAVQSELKNLRGEKARRLAITKLAWVRPKRLQAIYTMESRRYNSPIYFKFGDSIIDLPTKWAVDSIINNIHSIDPSLFDTLVGRLPNSFIDPIIEAVDFANDCVYAFNDQEISD